MATAKTKTKAKAKAKAAAKPAVKSAEQKLADLGWEVGPSRDRIAGRKWFRTHYKEFSVGSFDDALVAAEEIEAFEEQFSRGEEEAKQAQAAELRAAADALDGGEG